MAVSKFKKNPIKVLTLDFDDIIRVYPVDNQYCLEPGDKNFKIRREQRVHRWHESYRIDAVWREFDYGLTFAVFVQIS